MFAAMLWKELREQAAILIAILVLGTGVIAVAVGLGSTTGSDAGLGDFRAYTNAGRLAVLALTIAAGVVIGSSLFAGEIENETMSFLEGLPARRWLIWRSKLLAGIVLMFTTGTILFATGSLLGALGTSSRGVWILAGSLLMVIAFGWGTLGSTMSRNTLGACAGGLLGSVLFGVPIFVIGHSLLLAATRMLTRKPPVFWLQLEPVFMAYVVALVPIFFGSIIFTAQDRQRFRTRVPDSADVPTAMISAARPPSRFRSLFWMIRQQWLIIVLVGTALAISAGLSTLLEEMQLIIAWPLIACGAGVCAGVFTWSDDQSRGSYRFWGERRLPLGMTWLMKVASSFVVALFWIVILFLPVLIRTLASERRGPVLARVMGDGILGEFPSDLLSYLLIWPLYGLAFGNLTGLLFRKTIVALGVGLLTAAPLAAFWLPSLITGGVHHWLLWPVPLIVLVTSRLLQRSWSIDRLASLHSLTLVALCGLLVILWTSFGIAWRFLEVELTPTIDQEVELIETIPQLDSDDGGRAYRQAVSSSLVLHLNPLEIGQNRRTFFDPKIKILDRIVFEHLAKNDWPIGELKEYQEWLEQEQIISFIEQLKAAALKPLGPIENPRVLVVNSEYRDANEIPSAVGVLLARGLLEQQLGRPAEFVRLMDAALAVTRNARTLQPTRIYLRGTHVEAVIFQSLDVWLKRLEPNAELMRSALDVLRKHEKLCPRTAAEAVMIDRVIDRNTLDAIGQWAPKELEMSKGGDPLNDGPSVFKQKAEVESELASFAVTIPWERERLRRMMGIKIQDDRSRINTQRVNSWFGDYVLNSQSIKLDEPNLLSESHLAVAMAQTALTAFALEHNRPANDWQELVPDYLEAIPIDPYDGRPLRFRVSNGERIQSGQRDFDPRQSDIERFYPHLSPVFPLLFEWELHEPLGALIGGVGFSDVPTSVAPGFRADGVAFVDMDALGALAGGLVQWPLESLDGSDEMDSVPGSAIVPEMGFERQEQGTRQIDWRMIWLDVPSGKTVVWSIGPDRLDQKGSQRFDPFMARNGIRTIGDLIRIARTR